MIREFIIEHFKKKLKDLPALVIYDPDQRYREILVDMADENTRVFDINHNVLTIREEAISYYTTELSEDNKSRMLVYVPFAAPLTRQEQLMDPFYIFSFGGSVFPNDAADKFENLCKACFADKEQKITELFAQEVPDFDTLDALGGGNTWAKLQTLTGGKSEKEIILALLAPTVKQQEGLTKDKTWYKEYKDIASLIGLQIKEKNYAALQNELWRFLLFSEFVFDLPIELPVTLKNIPMARSAARPLVMAICKSLRNNKNCEDLYIEKAEDAANQLGLADMFKNEHELGVIITFAFEDNTYFYHFTDLLIKRKIDGAKEIIARIKENIWLHHDEERRRYWKMAELGLGLIQLASEKTKTSTSLKTAIDQYAQNGYKIDQLQRRFEKIAIEVLQDNTALTDLKQSVRKEYSKYTEKNQKQFQELVQKEHWPVEGLLCNIQVFAKHIQPLLKSKTKTAYLFVDALRFELAKELEENIEKYFIVQVTTSCAFLPTVTKFGMAALLPEAEKELTLKEHKGSLEAFIGDKALLSLTQRRDYLKEKLGDLCDIITLDKLVSSTIPDTDLLIVTTNEIDNAGENMASNALLAMQQASQNLIKGLNLLKQKGYEKIVIATDHGFVLHPIFQSGDNVSKPAGDWLMSKSRSLAGSGATPDYAIGFIPAEIGVKSDAKNFVFLKNYAVFEKNTTYFHEGISLQESIVPVMVLTAHKTKKDKTVQVNVSYKGKTTGNITTRTPFMEISCFIQGELGFEPIAIRMEALANDEIVGKSGFSEYVNEVSNLLEIVPGQAYKIPLEMNTDFEGSFEVRLSDPVTNKTYASITLQTDYIS
ncbi:MAG: PglZ domain-containing protein [Bacteroidetes bacterium]|nr:PglZ domain-containing protein [Bacteroidota bacterium]